jgi:hypothetical protein
VPKFRKKPAVVEAEQFGGFYATPYPPGVQVESPTAEHAGRFYVVTAHGQRAYLEPGDWVIAEPDNRGYYPCKPDIFAATYEEVK